MREFRKPKRSRIAKRRYHLADDEPMYFDNEELPAWLVGAD
jgi:hypothetical protein